MSHDIAIIGAGIAGASLAAELAPHASVLLLEAEDQPGYHATGRSAAFWSETYGGPLVQPLTTASHNFLADRGFLDRCGALHIADTPGEAVLDGFLAEFADSEVELERLDRPQLEALVPGLRPPWRSAVYEPSCANIDVGGLHQTYLAAARRAKVELRCGARIGSIERTDAGWRLGWPGGSTEAQLLVDAAGAWADKIAEMAGVDPLGIRSFRRTVLQIKTDPAPPADLPLVVEARGRFYFKPEAGSRLWLSPHDETPEPAGDTAAQEIDVATAIDRFEKAVDWKVARLERKWAGQRSFALDRLPAFGFDLAEPRFFWCAGQGGFGIQTAPAAATLCASLILGDGGPKADPSLDPAPYAPARFRIGG